MEHSEIDALLAAAAGSIQIGAVQQLPYLVFVLFSFFKVFKNDIFCPHSVCEFSLLGILKLGPQKILLLTLAY